MMVTAKPMNPPVHVYLKPGELCISKQPAVVTTVLGSCISVTFFHRPSGLAAICHALQPRCQQTAPCPTQCPNRYRYAACVIEEMSHCMAGKGVYLKEVEVKLFGGAAMMGRFNGKTMAHSVGQQNIEAAMQALAKAGLTIKVADVGGFFGRKLIFDTVSGDVLLKRIRQNCASSVHS
jgi:chemotaxis protein CheD